MTRVVDVAKYILEKQGRITPMKLQKLVYYAQVWAMTIDNAPLFDETIKAWAQGPVVPSLFQEHKGRASIDAPMLAGDSTRLTGNQRARIDAVLAFYGAFPAGYLSQLTHHDRPWKDARAAGERAGHMSPSITTAEIRSFYAGRRPEDLEADYQVWVASALMDQHAESLARLAL